MSFTRVNPLGWALFEELTSAQMNQLDINHSNAIDGADGGTYNLASPLVLNGADVTIDNFIANTVKHLGSPDVVTINNGDLGGTTALDIAADGRAHRLDARGVDQVGFLAFSLTGPFTDGQQLILEVLQSSTLHGAVTQIATPSSFNRNLIGNLYPTDELMVDPRTNTVTRWEWEWNAQGNNGNGWWHLKNKSVEVLYISDPTNAYSSGYGDLSRGFLSTIWTGTEPRTTMRSLAAPMSLVKAMDTNASSFPSTYFPISRLVYSPAIRAVVAVLGDAEFASATRIVGYTYNGSNWHTLNSLPSEFDSQAFVALALVPNTNGDKTTDRIMVGARAAVSPYNRRQMDISSGADDSHGIPSASAVVDVVLNSDYRRIINADERFIIATDNELTGVSAGKTVGTVPFVNEGFRDVCRSADNRIMAAADDGDIWFAPASGVGAPVFSEVYTGFGQIVRGIAYCGASDQWVALLNDGTVSVSDDNGASWNTVINDTSLVANQNYRITMMGVGGAVMIATGDGALPSDDGYLVSFRPDTAASWFRMTADGNGRALSAGCAWIGGKLMFTTDPVLSAASAGGTPSTFITETVGEFGPLDFDR